MYISLICIISSIMLASAKQTYVDLTPETIALMSEKSVACIEETGADSNIFQRVLLWQFGDDGISKEFYFCLFKNVGLIDNSGHFYTDHVLGLYENSNRKDEVLLVAEECNKFQEKTPLDTMFASLHCFAKKTPEVLQAKID